MTTMVVDSAEYSVAAAMTVGQLRDLIGDLADDSPLHIGVYGHHHFNSVLGTMPVTSARVEPIPGGVIVLPVSYTHLRAHETPEHLVCRLLLEKKKKKKNRKKKP